MTTVTAIEKLAPLTIEQRGAAIESARLQIAGRKPQESDYLNGVIDKFPPAYKRFTRRAVMVVILAAFFVSSFRVAMAAANKFYESVVSVLFQNADQTVNAIAVLSILVGVAFVILAETGQIIFMVNYQQAQTRGQKIGLALGAGLCTLIALAGNAQFLGNEVGGLWGLLETFSPPLIVLVATMVIEQQLNDEISTRYQAQKALEEALNAWQYRLENADTINPTLYLRVCANHLRDALRRANNRQKIALRDLTETDWKALVEREFKAENWFDVGTVVEQKQLLQKIDDTPEIVKEKPKRKSGAGGGGKTGEAENVIQKGESFFTQCPHCSTEFESKTALGAKRAAAGHMANCSKRNAEVA